MDVYRPVSCDFHDVLEVAATQRRRIAVVFRSDDETIEEVLAVVEDIFAKVGEEYLKLDSGEVIRLGALIAVDGFRASDF